MLRIIHFPSLALTIFNAGVILGTLQRHNSLTYERTVGSSFVWYIVIFIHTVALISALASLIKHNIDAYVISVCAVALYLSFNIVNFLSGGTFQPITSIGSLLILSIYGIRTWKV